VFKPLKKIRTPLNVTLVVVVLGMSFLQRTTVADENKTAFVEANILSIFYHELGHAVIDLLQVPIYGQEEDAADNMSVLMIHQLFEEESAQSIAYDSAFGYINDPNGTEAVAYWDIHGPDEQRYYNHVCLFYGANPDERELLANDLGLPAERAETCVEEYEQADASWGLVFQELSDPSSPGSLEFVASSNPDDKLLNDLLSAEIEDLNAYYYLPESVQVTVEACDEPNAFYDPNNVSITVCSEFVEHLETLYEL
jgi:hypothetical protein